MAITISGSGITSANIADGTITTDDILASDVNSLKSGRKNLLINGGMDVWQRGTSFSSATNGQYVIDRWQTFGASLTCAISRSTDVPADQGFKYSAQINRTAHGLPFLRQPIEDFSTLISGRTVTLSFWAKSDVACTFQTDLGDVGHITHSVTTSWQKFTALYPSTLNPSYTAVDFESNSSSAATMHITGVQLEVGSVATDFEHRSYGEELALCQRYFEYIQSGEIPEASNYYSGYRYLNPIQFSVTKRATPSVTVISQGGWPYGSGGTYSAGGNTNRVSITGGSGNALINQLHSYTLHIDAEL